VLVVDQLSKAWVRAAFLPQQSVPVIQNVFHLTYVRNLGAAFGLFPGARSVFMLTTTAVLFVIAAYWRRARPTAWPIVIALALVTGGAIGNLIDRAWLGQVTDFFDFTFLDFPVFNIADSGVVIGVIILMAWILFGPDTSSDDDAEQSAEPETEPPAMDGEAGSGAAPPVVTADRGGSENA
jgi:signal peptidase II